MHIEKQRRSQNQGPALQAGTPTRAARSRQQAAAADTKPQKRPSVRHVAVLGYN